MEVLLKPTSLKLTILHSVDLQLRITFNLMKFPPSSSTARKKYFTHFRVKYYAVC